MTDAMCSCDGPPHVYTQPWCGPAPRPARNSGAVSCPPTETGLAAQPAPAAREAHARPRLGPQSPGMFCEFYESLAEPVAPSTTQGPGTPAPTAAADEQGADRDWTIPTTGKSVMPPVRAGQL